MLEQRRREGCGSACATVVLALCFSTSGCPGPTDCTNPVHAETCGKDKVELVLTVASPIARMRSGEGASIAVSIERKGEWLRDATVTFSAVDLVNGVSMEPVAIGPEATETTLKLHADGVLPQGVFPFSVLAQPSDHRIPLAEARLEAVIPGPRGTFDLSFGADGTVLLKEYGRRHVAYGADQDASGRLLIAGRTYEAPPRAWLVRLQRDGTLDTEFTERASDSFESVLASGLNEVHIVAEGALVAGRVRASEDPNNPGELIEPLLVARLAENGSLDPTFGTRGAYINHETDPGFSYSPGYPDYSQAFLVLRENDLVAGVSQNTYRIDAVLSLLPDGRINEEFGEGGYLIGVDPPASSPPLVGQEGIVYWQSGSSLQLLKGDTFAPFESDLSTIEDKIKTLDSRLKDAYFVECDVGPANQILCAGSYEIELEQEQTSRRAWTARILADGKLDPSFGQGGIVLRSTRAATVDVENQGVEILEGGATLLCGFDDAGNGVVTSYLLAQYPDGSPQLPFGDEGKAVIFTYDYRRMVVDRARGQVSLVYSLSAGLRIDRYWL
ncbi:MAG: delta-60 repeat domain-containing protein [Myxococcales bacterium]|nr:delta-60 repeat domain-containing protein [Myxococcales bacterium]